MARMQKTPLLALVAILALIGLCLVGVADEGNALNLPDALPDGSTLVSVKDVFMEVADAETAWQLRSHMPHVLGGTEYRYVLEKDGQVESEWGIVVFEFENKQVALEDFQQVADDVAFVNKNPRFVRIPGADNVPEIKDFLESNIPYACLMNEIVIFAANEFMVWIDDYQFITTVSRDVLSDLQYRASLSEAIEIAGLISVKTLEALGASNLHAQITAFDIDYGEYKPGDKAYADVTVENTGSTAHNFYLGYSVQDKNGDWWDAPCKNLHLSLGETATIRLAWEVQPNVPEGLYRARVAVGKGVSGGKLLDLFDEVGKEDAFIVEIPTDTTTPLFAKYKPKIYIHKEEKWKLEGVYYYGPLYGYDDYAKKECCCLEYWFRFTGDGDKAGDEWEPVYVFIDPDGEILYCSSPFHWKWDSKDTETNDFDTSHVKVYFAKDWHTPIIDYEDSWLRVFYLYLDPFDPSKYFEEVGYKYSLEPLEYRRYPHDIEHPFSPERGDWLREDWEILVSSTFDSVSFSVDEIIAISEGKVASEILKAIGKSLAMHPGRFTQVIGRTAGAIGKIYGILTIPLWVIEHAGTAGGGGCKCVSTVIKVWDTTSNTPAIGARVNAHSLMGRPEWEEKITDSEGEVVFEERSSLGEAGYPIQKIIIEYGGVKKEAEIKDPVCLNYVLIAITPLSDSDGDGIPDDQDDCPFRPGPPDNNGCPKEEPLPPTGTILVMDVSSSMGWDWKGGVKIESAKKAALNFIEHVAREAENRGTDHRIAIVAFSTTAQILLPLTSNYEKARKTVISLDPVAATNIGDGLIKGLQELQKLEKDSQRFMILLSDGVSNRGLSSQRILSGPVARARQQGICIHTVGFGDPGDIDQAFLRRIATESGCGTYGYAETPTQLFYTYVRARHTALGNIMAEFSAIDERVVMIPDLPSALGTVIILGEEREMHYTLAWSEEGAMTAQLRDPSGRVFDSSVPGVVSYSGETFSYVMVPSPPRGVWTVEAVPAFAVPEETEYYAVVSTRPGGSAIALPLPTFRIGEWTFTLPAGLPAWLLIAISIAGFFFYLYQQSS